VTAIDLGRLELADAWIDDDETARWRSASAHGPDSGARASGSSLLEVPPECRLPRHTDSAEEVIVLVDGEAEVIVEGRPPERLSAPGIALVPADAPHEVRNVGGSALRFLALYAGTDVVTRYEAPVQPGGERERKPLG
jgi:quercetin dioxygenase-like cupin family protein